MTEDGTLTHAVRAQARAWRHRGYLMALTGTLLVATVTAQSVGAALLVLPSLALSAALLFTARVPGPSTAVYLCALAIGAATLVWAALTGANVAGSAGISIGLALVISRRSKRPVGHSVIAWSAITAVSSTAMIVSLDTGVLTMLLLSMMSASWLAAILDAEGQSTLFDLLEQAKDTERELGILRERDRFAADLHDVQGHSLHVVKLKAAVVQRVMDTDGDRAREEIMEIQQLTADAIAQGRELARASHQLDLLTEVHNAQNLLESAGITAELIYGGSATSTNVQTRSRRTERAMALVLREAVTNILRHSHAGRASIELDPDGLAVINDGVPEHGATPVLSGLGTLRRRVHEAGGELAIAQESDSFRIALRFTAEDTA